MPCHLDSVLRESNAPMCAMLAAPDADVQTKWRMRCGETVPDYMRRGMTLAASSPPSPRTGQHECILSRPLRLQLIRHQIRSSKFIWL